LDEYLSLRPEVEAQPLPQEQNGYRMVESGPTFSGGMIRQHDWVVAMSAIMPVPGESVYRLERQSRLDVWHEKSGLIVGGGPNLIGSTIPMANVHLVTGYGGVDCDYGLLSGGEVRDRRAVYFPRSVETSLSLEEQCLRESFGQGDVVFTVRPLDEKRLIIVFDFDVFAARKIFVQLPLILFYNSEVRVDDKVPDKEKLEQVSESVVISNPTTATRVKISVPEKYPAALRPAIDPLRWYGGDHPDQRYRPFYGISLLSVRIDSPNGRGMGEFVIEIFDD
jgi:hypothetical protein